MIKRLGKKHGTIRQLFRGWSYACRSQDDLNWWPTPAQYSSEAQPVHCSWHVDVCQHQANIEAPLEQGDGMIGIMRLQHFEASTLRYIDHVETLQRFVLHDEDDRCLGTGPNPRRPGTS